MEDIFSLTVSQLRDLVPDPLPESDLVVTKASSFSNPMSNSVIFAKRLRPEDLIELEPRVTEALILVPLGFPDEGLGGLRRANVVASVPNPRLTFARIMNAALESQPVSESFREIGGARISSSASIHPTVLIEAGAFIDHHVTIEGGCRILSGAKVRAYTQIGAGTVVRENATVGVQGFGFERDELQRPIRLPHFGGVVIGENVEIGSLASICSGTIDPTRIGDHAKIDNLVHVAHNCTIGLGTMIAACAELSGSVSIGDYSWISPNVSILEGIKVGRHAWVGMGSVVMRYVDDDDKVSGNPARSIRGIGSH